MSFSANSCDLLDFLQKYFTSNYAAMTLCVHIKRYLKNPLLEKKKERKKEKKKGISFLSRSSKVVNSG